MKKILLCVPALCLALFFAACSTDTPGHGADSADDLLSDFLASAAGTWYCHGNLNGYVLEISSDGSWSHPDGSVEIEGIVTAREDDDEGYELCFSIVSEDGSSVNYITPGMVDGGVVFKEYPYYKAEDSIDMSSLEGYWYLDGDKDNNYYKVEGSKWVYMEQSGAVSIQSASGFFAWSAADETLKAYEFFDEPVAAVFSLDGDRMESETGETYILQ